MCLELSFWNLPCTSLKVGANTSRTLHGHPTTSFFGFWQLAEHSPSMPTCFEDDDALALLCGNVLPRTSYNALFGFWQLVQHTAGICLSSTHPAYQPVLKTMTPLLFSVGTGRMLELIKGPAALPNTAYWPFLGLILHIHKMATESTCLPAGWVG